MLYTNRGYHEKCFVCGFCGKEFSDMKFTQGRGKLLHHECLKEINAPKCAKCNKSIMSGFLPFKDGKIHPECYQCTSCHTLLNNQAHVENKLGDAYCYPCADSLGLGRERVQTEPDKYCLKCNGVVQDGLTLSNDRAIHKTCFTCGTCGMQLSPEDRLIDRDNGTFFHVECFERTNAQMCAKCGNPLLDGSVPYNGLEYHEECMTCTSCNVSLVGVHFTENESGQPVCKACAPVKKTIQSAKYSSNNPLTKPLEPEFSVEEDQGLGTKDRCPRCKQKVFYHDQIFGPRATLWHKKCLYCQVCRKTLDATAVLVDGIVYCRDHGRGKK